MYSSSNKFDTFAIPSAPVTNVPTVLPVTIRITSNSAFTFSKTPDFYLLQENIIDFHKKRPLGKP